jgi:hypothetical protein
MALMAIIVLLSVPWIDATSAALFDAWLFPAAFLVYMLHGGRTQTLAAAVASAAAILVLFVLASHPGAPPGNFVSAAHPPIDPNLAEASWRALTLGDTTNRPVMWLLRLPTWLALIALVVMASTLTRRTDLETAVRPG